MLNFVEGFDKYHHKGGVYPHFQKVQNPPLTPEKQKLRTAVRQSIFNHQKAKEESQQATLWNHHTSPYKNSYLIRNRCVYSR